MTPLAMCICGEPLVMTFAFSGLEWICVRCARQYTYFGPSGVTATPERLARAEANKAAWVELSEGLIPMGGHLTDCERCRAEPHSDHATADELLAHDAAMLRIDAIRRATFA